MDAQNGKQMKLEDRHKNRNFFLLSVLMGVLIWLCSPSLTGKTAPWDSSSVYYFGSLFVCGFILGMLGKQLFFVWPFGIVLGQLIFIVILRIVSNDLKLGVTPRDVFQLLFAIYAGLFYLTLFSWPCFVGSATATCVVWAITRKQHKK